MRVGLQLLYPRQRLLGGDPGSHALLFTYVFLPASPFLGVVRLREPTREYLVYVYVAPGSHPGYQVSSKFSGGDAVFSHGVLERLDEPELEFLHVGVTHPVQDMGLHVRVEGVVMLVFLIYLEDAQHPVHRVLYGHVVVHEALHGLRKVSGVGVEQRSAHGGRMLLEPSGVRSTHGAQKLAFPQGGPAQRRPLPFSRALYVQTLHGLLHPVRREHPVKGYSILVPLGKLVGVQSGGLRGTYGHHWRRVAHWP